MLASWGERGEWLWRSDITAILSDCVLSGVLLEILYARAGQFFTSLVNREELYE